MAFGFATFVTFLLQFHIYIVTASNCKSPFRWLYTSFKPQVLLVKPKMFDGFCWWNPTNPWVFCHFSSFPGGLAASLRGVQGGGSAQDLLRAVGLLGHLLGGVGGVGRVGWRWGTFIPGAGEVIVAKPCISVDLLWDIWYTQPCDIWGCPKMGYFHVHFDLHISIFLGKLFERYDMTIKSDQTYHQTGGQSHWSILIRQVVDDFYRPNKNLNSSSARWYPNFNSYPNKSGSL